MKAPPIANPTPALTHGERPVRLALAAHDDDRLAGWRLDLRDDDDAVTLRLGGGPLAGPDFETEVAWDLTDRDKERLPPGRYRVVAEVVDRAGNTARAEAAVVICEVECP